MARKITHLSNFTVRYFAIAAFLSSSLSCTHTPVVGDLVTNQDHLLELPRYEFDFSSPQSLRREIQKLKLDKPRDQETLERLIVAFYKLTKNFRSNELSIGPQTKIRLELLSYCASSRKAIPENNEVFRWVKGPPQIPLVNQILNFNAQNPTQKQAVIQELLWNLENKTYYEDYPEDLRKILAQASPTAKLTLPSRLRSRIADEILPDQIKDSIEFMTGKYYSFDEFRSSLEKKKSKITLPPDYFGSKIPTTDLLAFTASRGYELQSLIFYNLSGRDVTLKLTDFYLQSVRTDVQPIILASVMPGIEELNRILNEAATRALGYLGSQYPTLNSAEKNLVKRKPQEAFVVFRRARTAESEANTRFPKSSANGASDAFRHFTWAGLMTRDLSEGTAREFLSAHEEQPDQPLEEKTMDDYNNEQGILAAKRLLKNGPLHNRELFDLAQNEIKNGKLKILNPQQKNQNEY